MLNLILISWVLMMTTIEIRRRGPPRKPEDLEKLTVEERLKEIEWKLEDTYSASIRHDKMFGDIMHPLSRVIEILVGCGSQLEDVARGKEKFTNIVDKIRKLLKQEGF